MFPTSIRTVAHSSVCVCVCVCVPEGNTGTKTAGRQELGYTGMRLAHKHSLHLTFGSLSCWKGLFVCIQTVMEFRALLEKQIYTMRSLIFTQVFHYLDYYGNVNEMQVQLWYLMNTLIIPLVLFVCLIGFTVTKNALICFF